jgi:hypothetical protein
MLKAQSLKPKTSSSIFRDNPSLLDRLKYYPPKQVLGFGHKGGFKFERKCTKSKLPLLWPKGPPTVIRESYSALY